MLLLVGVLIHFLGSHVLHAVLPPAVTGAVVMLIGFNLAPVVANIYWPQDQWVALATMTFVILVAVGLRGFLGRIAIFLGLIFGYLLSWFNDHVFGQITSFDAAADKVTIARPGQLGQRQGRRLDRLPAAHQRRQGRSRPWSAGTGRASRSRSPCSCCPR